MSVKTIGHISKKNICWMHQIGQLFTQLLAIPFELTAHWLSDFLNLHYISISWTGVYAKSQAVNDESQSVIESQLNLWEIKVP